MSDGEGQLSDQSRTVTSESVFISSCSTQCILPPIIFKRLVLSGFLKATSSSKVYFLNSDIYFTHSNDGVCVLKEHSERICDMKYKLTVFSQL